MYARVLLLKTNIWSDQYINRFKNTPACSNFFKLFLRANDLEYVSQRSV